MKKNNNELKSVFAQNHEPAHSPASLCPHREPPMPPHIRHALLSVEFDEADRKALSEIFLDEDTAFAVEQIIRNSPPEIQIIAYQALRIYEEVN